ncbi:MAG: methytransferase partner Trm112 [Dehalococcoidia bacterium]|nr:methytransferase partner Trm112 [Dehalococcoidia bacterium]
MLRDLVEILACTVCHEPLTLAVTREDGVEVLTGTLTCAACGEVYPISDGIPNLLPPDLRKAIEAEASGAAR